MHVQIRTHFPRWNAHSPNHNLLNWTQGVDWSDQHFLAALLDHIDHDFETYWPAEVDVTSEFAASLLGDIVQLEAGEAAPHVVHQLEYLRFYIATRVMELGLSRGRFSVTHDWILCSISKRPFAHIEPGQPVVVEYEPRRLFDFVTSPHATIKPDAPVCCSVWIHSLLYYSQRQGVLHDLVEEIYPLLVRVAGVALASHEGFTVTKGVVAVCQLASWGVLMKRNDAKETAMFLAQVFDDPEASVEVRKLAGLALSGDIGECTSMLPSEWASRTLALPVAFHGHERLQLLVNASIRENGVAKRLEEILRAIREYTAEVMAATGWRSPEFYYGQIRLFNIIAPVIVQLAEGGRCSDVVRILAIWYGVDDGYVRRSPVMLSIPNHEMGALYAVEGLPLLFDRDQQESLQRITELTNLCLNTAISLVNDPTPLAPITDRGDSREHQRRAALFGKELQSFHAIDRLVEERELLGRATGLVLATSLSHPIQAIMLHRLGFTFPLVSSFEEPDADRAIRRAVLWTAGTFTGGHEVRAVDRVLRKHGVNTEVHDGEDWSVEQFGHYYSSSEWDVVWINAHGEFDSADPHKSYIYLSADKKHTISLTQLMQLPVPTNGRRLLFWNICLGGTAYVAGGSPKLGIGAMLASRHQAIVSHLWTVSSFVAPAFGLLMAFGLIQHKAFFPAFCYAVQQIRSEREALVGIVERQEAGLSDLLPVTHGVDVDDITTWGSAVFYE